MLKSWVFWVRLFLGTVFVAAGVEKIVHPEAFAKIIHNHRVLPDALVNLTALILPWLEILLGFLLMGGWWLPGAVLLVNLLLALFLGTLLFNIARGLDVHCGCFTTSTEGAVQTSWYLFRDTVLLLMGGTLFFRQFVGCRSAERPSSKNGYGR